MAHNTHTHKHSLRHIMTLKRLKAQQEAINKLGMCSQTLRIFSRTHNIPTRVKFTGQDIRILIPMRTMQSMATCMLLRSKGRRVCRAPKVTPRSTTGTWLQTQGHTAHMGFIRIACRQLKCHTTWVIKCSTIILRTVPMANTWGKTPYPNISGRRMPCSV